MSYEDERIVKMTFDNESFKKGVQETIKALDNLDKKINSIDAGTSYKTFDKLTQSVGYTEKAVYSVDTSIQKVQASFSALQVVGATVLSELTRSAMSMGKSLWNNTFGQIKSGGVSRAMNIEAAKFQLEGLGVAWDDISEKINYGVKGTAYGLDEAARAAAQFSASFTEGLVDKYKELYSTTQKEADIMSDSLRAISGVAAMTNSSYSEIANIFTTVAGNGKLMTMQLRQLSYRGMNAAATLAEQLNMTEEEIYDLVSKGKIGFAEFAHAMDSAFGEHAKKANDTFTGALSNMKAALSRIGEKFVTPWHEMERVIFNAVTPLIDLIGKVVNLFKPTFEEITQELSKWVENLAKNENFVRGILNIAVGIYSWIYNIVKALREAGYALPNIDKITKAFEEFTKIFLLEGDAAVSFREKVVMVAKVLELVVRAIGKIISALAPLISMGLNFLKDVANNTNGVRDKIEAVVEQIAAVIFLVGKFIAMSLPNVLKTLITIIPAVTSALKKAIVVIGVIGAALGSTISAIVDFATSFKENCKSAIHNVAILAEAFYKFYEKVKDIFVSIGGGIATFVDSIGSGAKSLMQKVSELYSNKTVKANVVVDVQTPKLDPASLVQSDAASKVKNTASAVSDYASSVKSADKQAKSFGATGGHLKGAFGGGQVVGATAAVMQYAKAQQEAADITEATTSTIAKATEAMNARMQDSMMDTTVVVKEKSIFGKIKDAIPDEILGFFEDVAAKYIIGHGFIMDAVELFGKNIAAIITSGAGLIAASIAASTAVVSVAVVKAISALTANLRMLPELTGAIGNMAKAQKYDAMADMLPELGKFLLAFGALLIIIGIISKYVDPEAFATIIKYSALFVLAVSVMVGAAGLLSLGSGIKEIGRGINNISKAIPQAEKKKGKIIKGLEALGDFFKGLAVLVLALTGTIGLISVYITKFGSPTELWQSLGLIAAMLMMIALFTRIMSKIIGNGSMISNMQEISLATKSVKKSSTNALGGIIALLYSFIPLILSITGAVAILAQFDMDTVAISFALLMGAIATLMGTMIFMVMVVSKALGRGNGSVYATEVIGKALSDIMKSMGKMMAAIVLFLVGFALAAKILSVVDQGKLGKYIKIIAVAFGALILVMSGFLFWLSQLKRQTSEATTLGKYTDFMEGSLQGIAEVIKSFSIAFIAFAASLAILRAIDGTGYSDKLFKYVGVMALMMGALALFVVIVGSSMMQFNKSFKHTNFWNQKTDSKLSIKQMDNMGEQLALIIKSMSKLALSISISIAALSMVPDPDMLTRAALVMGAVMLALGFAIAIMAKAMTNMDKSMSEGDKLTKSSTRVGPNASQTMATAIRNMCIFVLAVTAAIAAVYLMAKNPGQLAVAFGVLGIMIMIVAGGISILISQINNLLTSTKGFDSKVISKKLGNLAGILLISMAAVAMALGAVVGMASVFDKLNPESVNKAILAASVAIAGIIVLVGLIGMLSGNGKKKAGNTKVKAPSATIDAKSLFGIAAALLALGTIFAIMAATMKVLSTVEWENMDKATPYLIGFVAFAGILTALFLIFGKNLQAAVPGMIAFMGIVVALSLLAVAMGASALLFAEAIDRIKEVMISLTGVDITDATLFAKNFSDFISQIWFALVIAGFLAIPALAFAKGIEILVRAMQGIKDIPAENLEYLVGIIKYICKSIAESIGVILVATLGILLLSLLGPLITIAIASLLVGMMMMPALIEWIDKTLATLAAHSKSMMTSIKTITENLVQGLESMYNDINFDIATKLTLYLLALGVSLFFAGLGLLAGSVGLILGGYVLKLAAEVLRDSLEEVYAQVIEGVGGGKIMIISGALLGLGLAVGIGGLLMSLGAAGLLIGSLALLGSAYALKAALEKLSEAYQYMDFGEFSLLMLALIGLAAESIIVGIALIAGGGLLLVGSAIFLLGCLAITASIMLLSYSMSLLEGLGGGVKVFAALMDQLKEAMATAIWMVIPSALLLVVSALFLASTAILKIALDNIAKMSTSVVKCAITIAAVKSMSTTFLSASTLLLAASVIFVGATTLMIVGGALFIASAAMIAGGLAILEAAYEGMSWIVEEFSNIGTDIINGLVHGIEAGWEAVKESFSNLGNMVVEAFRSSDVDSHSDSRGFIDIAKDIIGGLVHGTEAGEPTVMQCFGELGDKIVDKFSGMGNSITSIAEAAGINAGEGLKGGILGGIGDTIKQGLPAMAGFFNSISSMGDAEINRQIKQYNAQIESLGTKISSVYELYHGEPNDPAVKQQLDKDKAELDTLRTLVRDLEKSKSSTGNELDASGLVDQLFKAFNLDGSGGGGGGGIPDTSGMNPDLQQDLDRLGNGGSAANTAMASNVGGNVGNTITTNNNYNFIQNNYSPEPIDRTELYTQTENQHYTWYKWLRDNS